ncbi:hypothetical protein [Saccharothrix sp. Mg75]|uniref:hypothetical protein n=1 Tax=Saccharothrix sp. Mg75 TaxID=3445357 RepID=UPI003EEA6E9D
MADVVRWCYGIWPSYGAAIVLASLVISIVFAPLLLFEARLASKKIAFYRTLDTSSGVHVDEVFLHRALLRGPLLALMAFRRITMVAVAVVVAITLIGMTRVDVAGGGGPRFVDRGSALWLDLTRSRGEMDFGWVDLGESAFTVMTGEGFPAVVGYLVIPLVFTTSYALKGNKPPSGWKMYVFGALLMSLVVPGALVLYLLTVLVFNFVLLRSVVVADHRRQPG